MTDASRERLVREVRDVRRRGMKPEHWLYRVYQPVFIGNVGASFTDAMVRGRVRFGQRLMHPQEVADQQGGTWSPYYAARFPD